MSALSILWFLLGALDPQDCGPDQTWQWIPEAGIHACTMETDNRIQGHTDDLAADRARDYANALTMEIV